MNGASGHNGGSSEHVIPSLQLAFTVPTSPDTKVYLQMTNLPKSLLLYLSTATVGAPTSGVSLGSLVYAMPNNSNARSNEVLSTALYSKIGSVEFVTRLAKVLARKTRKPVHVGGEVRFWGVEDEGVALRGVVEVVMNKIQEQESTDQLQQLEI